MITRCTENDIRRVAQKVINDKHPWEALSIQRFEKNLTSREAKRPSFQFNITHKNVGKTPGTVGPLSLAGSDALTVIAEAEELAVKKVLNLGPSRTFMTEFGRPRYYLEVRMDTTWGLQKYLSVYVHIFLTNGTPINPSNEEGYISIYDACELPRQRLNQCATLLRTQGTFYVDTYKRWAETYFQINLLLFERKGLSPYKLKLPLIAQLVESGHIEKPWNHLCEGLEKSNHNANRHFQSRTMRGDGSIYHQDPLFLDTAFSFCRFLDIFSTSSEKKISNVIEHVRKTLTTEETLEGAKTYPVICRTPLALPCLAVGEKRKFCDLLRGLRFTIVGRFKRGLTQDFLKDRISETGGVVYEKENAENIMKSHSNILKFYVIVKDEEDLINATGDKHQLEAMRRKLKLHRRCTGSELSTDAESREDEKCSTKKKLSPAALACKRFASGVSCSSLLNTYSK